MPEEAKITELEGKFRRQLGDRIRSIRKQKGINQDDLAHLAGIHRAHVGTRENARIDPKLSTLLKVAHALDVSMSELLRNCEDGWPLGQACSP
jgi:transcriptional regulator with XRE-family HTH domain